jgi:hypothetical protein
MSSTSGGDEPQNTDDTERAEGERGPMVCCVHEMRVPDRICSGNPDGSFTYGKATLAPDALYVSGKGSYIAKISRPSQQP